MWIAAALLLLAVLSTTPESRAKARLAIRPYERDIGIAAAILWFLLIVGSL